VQVVTRQLSRG